MKIVEINSSNYPIVAQIYQEGIETGMATFEEIVPDWHVWSNNHLPYGNIALEVQNELVAWASLAPTSKRSAYRGVAEVSVYVSKMHQNKGYGKGLLHELIAISEKNGIWTLQAGIMRENEVSIKLHKKCGFREIGYREKIAKLKGVWRDNILLERRSPILI
ncbi:GNAT family N-acetyltransferase [Namhaeicola litoreus]|uniref:GNAT family N-acetyltransferase n=1 Tax=Namhaeicola litoreus TaxID=1052145 RepID=A0ABW3Y091_9FLAO